MLQAAGAARRDIGLGRHAQDLLELAVEVIGAEAGGALMLLFAASYPERVTALGLFAPLISYWKTPEFPFGLTEEEAADWRNRTEHEWGTASFWRTNMIGWKLRPNC